MRHYKSGREIRRNEIKDKEEKEKKIRFILNEWVCNLKTTSSTVKALKLELDTHVELGLKLHKNISLSHTS